MRRRWYVVLLFALLMLESRQGSAQGGGQISGTVTDSSGGVIPGAVVEATNERTGSTRSTVSDERGFFMLPALQASAYTVRATAQALSPGELGSLNLAAGESLSVKLVLKPAGISDSVVVVAMQERSTDTSSARIGATVNEREVSGLPLNGRQLSQLYLQAPGSVNTGSGTFFDIRFSGRSNEQNAIRFDGVEGSSIIDASPGNLNGEISSPFRLQTSLESVQEFRVESNSYPAEYGTGTGGQISVNTKSGSNQLHGSAFEYVRNDVLDARNFFDRASKSPLRLNQFGMSVGGPIVKERFFFFGSYEGYRLRSGINLVEAVPSEAARERAVPAIKPLIDAFRGPGSFILPGASTNPNFDIAQLQSGVIVNENSGAARFDFKLNQSNTLYARYFRDQGTASQPEGVTGRRTNYRSVPQNGVLSLQSLLTQRLINEFKFGYQRGADASPGIGPHRQRHRPFQPRVQPLRECRQHRHRRTGGLLGHRCPGRTDPRQQRLQRPRVSLHAVFALLHRQPQHGTGQSQREIRRGDPCHPDVHGPAGGDHLLVLQPRRVPGQPCPPDTVRRRPERPEPLQRRRHGRAACETGILHRLGAGRVEAAAQPSPSTTGCATSTTPRCARPGIWPPFSTSPVARCSPRTEAMRGISRRISARA